MVAANAAAAKSRLTFSWFASQPEATAPTTMNAYPTTQAMDVSANNANNATEQLQKEDGKAVCLTQ